MEEYRSPRRIEAEVNAYKRERFEFWMLEADKGNMTEEEAIETYRGEMLAAVALGEVMTS